MLVARTLEELRGHLREVRSRGDLLSLVPTMGALHDGHVSLLSQARGLGGAVAASIFVNPLQFGANEDFARYPRDEAGDLERLRQAGCDLVWLPGTDAMYAPRDATSVDVEGPALGWEGAARPGHFRGVATVVTKLFGQIRPDAALFGEKDWQQLQVIRRLEADLSLGIRIIGVATMREADGLARSSRNRFLSEGERAIAPLLYAALRGARAQLHAGAEVAMTLAQACAGLEHKGFAVDYLALVDGATMQMVTQIGAASRLIAAARLGHVRLIDNIAAG